MVRLDQSITPERLREALINAMISTNLANKQWGAEQQAAGHATLADIPADQIDEISIKVTLYKRAVYCFAKAELIERYSDFDATLTGTQRSDEMADTVEDYRRQGIKAMRECKEEPITTVELI